MAAAKNPHVFFDVTIDGIQKGRIEMDLYKDEVPLVAKNLCALCANANANKGNNPNPLSLSFKDSIFHRIIPGFMCQGGNFRKSHGTDAGRSIYGDKFPDAEMSRRCNMAFDLTTAHVVPKIPKNHTSPYPYTCGSQFFICIVPTPWLDGEHVVFGTVVAGSNTVLNMNSAGSRSGTPTKEVKIVDCCQIW